MAQAVFEHKVDQLGLAERFGRIEVTWKKPLVDTAR